MFCKDSKTVMCTVKHLMEECAITLFSATGEQIKMSLVTCRLESSTLFVARQKKKKKNNEQYFRIVQRTRFRKVGRIHRKSNVF